MFMISLAAGKTNNVALDSIKCTLQPSKSFPLGFKLFQENKLLQFPSMLNYFTKNVYESFPFRNTFPLLMTDHVHFKTITGVSLWRRRRISNKNF